jgi:O-antigen/teichoic acid export membrane protein
MSICLAALGLSYMSFAWAWIIGATQSSLLALYFRPDFWLFKPLMRRWREILTFGVYNGANVFLYTLYAAIPAMVLGRMVSLAAAGLYSRVQVICQLPDKVLLGGVTPVILPALAVEHRAGRSLKEPYLRAVSLITAVQWPILVVLAILAHTVVHFLLGDQWLEVVVPVQIMALALLFSSTNELNYPVLVSVGAMRDVLVRGLIAWPVSALIVASASLFGLIPAMLSFFLIIPFQAYLSIYFVRRHVPIAWMDLVHATWKSAIIAGCSAAGPLLIVALAGFRFDLSVPEGILAGTVAGIGWLAGVWLTDHPVLGELHLAGNALRRYWHGSAQQA